jgi:hypothetical protein
MPNEIEDAQMGTPSSPANQPSSWGPRLPILAGVLAGMVLWIVLGSLESLPFRFLSSLLFGELGRKEYLWHTGNLWMLRLILITFCAVGGRIGMSFSTWPRRKSGVFLAAILLVVTIVATIFPR